MVWRSNRYRLRAKRRAGGLEVEPISVEGQKKGGGLDVESIGVKLLKHKSVPVQRLSLNGRVFWERRGCQKTRDQVRLGTAECFAFIVATVVPELAGGL